ncbi:alpha-1,2-fucosyltransferase [Butyrivibrio sp.]|uniref:alpha-1,2-fucosyltransferase n=1 Tax=Butyrivibrio sp. TaxID=28121 RepID=UPI0025C124E0|nr:alpha-1,2-fucosyltransferase [Butyrivibrio sp.]MBE5837199.1 alpha-1,2-fucosyltransferase [Butyrivibrio sp.]
MRNKNTYIIEMTGGLGNQMFQYAFGKALECKYSNDTIKYDCSYYSVSNAIRSYSLYDAFGVDIKIANKTQVSLLRNNNPYDSELNRIANSFIRKALFRKPNEIIEDLDAICFGKIPDLDRDTYFSGYWQCEKYFKNLRSKIIRDFSFKLDGTSKDFLELMDRVKHGNSVAIHVRLEDYLNEENRKVYGNICDSHYYDSAVSYIAANAGKCNYYVFSTDIDSAMKLLPKGNEYIPIEYDCQKDYLDMYLMTICKHNIIANSTFSWWGAWLNNNPNRIVVCPKKWFNNHEVYNQYCESWIKV